ncbi:dihydrolipoyl dehydrogenase [Paracoccus sp. p3-h83]|uniref:dihydrolipoyl dehydrogenase n=1 Tax=Paracoccus sp. p3-h83 TaxID=3342805 RepID=UPI0035BAE4CA
MADRHVQIAIIGAGTAGMRAYREASRITDDLLLIEGARYGTTCARVGCMPSKLLIAAAEAAHHGSQTATFGVHYPAPRIDGRAVMARLRAERDRFAGLVVDTVKGWPARHRVMGRARFIDDHRLELDDGSRIRADRIVIATGSRPAIPPMFRDLGDRLVVNDDVFDWDDLPGAVAVIGAGVIGLELGQALHRLGVKVTLFGRDGLVGPLADPKVLAAARDILTAEFAFLPDEPITAVARDGDGVTLTHGRDGDSRQTRVDRVLVATGRRPNVDDLGLETTGLTLDDRGIPLFDPLSGQCGDSHIFIAGDATAEHPLLHEAVADGFAAGTNAANFPDVRRFLRTPALGIVFSDPQIMIVGEGHKALSARGADFATGALDWADQGRSRVMGINRGLLHLYAEHGSGRFLGAEMIGPRAEHLAHLLAWSLQSRLTVEQMLERPFYHPVIEEGLRTGLQNLAAALGIAPVRPRHCMDCGPGV